MYCYMYMYMYTVEPWKYQSILISEVVCTLHTVTKVTFGTPEFYKCHLDDCIEINVYLR